MGRRSGEVREGRLKGDGEGGGERNFIKHKDICHHSPIERHGLLSFNDRAQTCPIKFCTCHCNLCKIIQILTCTFVKKMNASDEDGCGVGFPAPGAGLVCCINAKVGLAG